MERYPEVMANLEKLWRKLLVCYATMTSLFMFGQTATQKHFIQFSYQPNVL